MSIGDIGWIAYHGERVIHVEFLGEGVEPGLPDYPYKPERYFRLLENVDCSSANLYAGRIIETRESEHDETVLHKTRKAALEEAVAYLEAWDERKKKEDNRYGEQAAKLRAEIAAISE